MAGNSRPHFARMTEDYDAIAPHWSRLSWVPAKADREKGKRKQDQRQPSDAIGECTLVRVGLSLKSKRNKASLMGRENSSMSIHGEFLLGLCFRVHLNLVVGFGGEM